MRCGPYEEITGAIGVIMIKVVGLVTEPEDRMKGLKVGLESNLCALLDVLLSRAVMI